MAPFGLFGRKKDKPYTAGLEVPIRSLRRARVDEEVKYTMQRGAIISIEQKYEGYKRAGSEPGRTQFDKERAAFEMSSLAKQRRLLLRQIRQTQQRTRLVDALINYNERREEYQRKGIIAKIEAFGPDKAREAAVKLLSLEKTQAGNLDEILLGLDAGVDDIVLEAERDADEQQALKEIMEAESLD